MRDVGCDRCGSVEAELYAERPPRADVLHHRFVRCRDCRMIYASPRASEDEMARHYGAVVPPSTPPADWSARVEGRAVHLRRAIDLLGLDGGRYLDVGFGDGSSLAAARSLGFEPVGIEASAARVEQARPLGEVLQGDAFSRELEPESFELVYSWHTIEHVPDVNAWLARLRELVRPSGGIMIGTESALSLEGRLWRLPWRALGRVPWPPTSTDHTYWFSPEDLRVLVERAGFSVARQRVYENAPRAVWPSGARGRALAAGMLRTASAAVCRARPGWGGKQVVVAARGGPAPSRANGPA